MMNVPRHVICKTLKSGDVAFYYNVPTLYRNVECPIRNEPLGTDYSVACKRAAALNGQFDDWDAIRRGLQVTGISAPRIGTVDWLFTEYKKHKAFTEKVGVRSRRNYEWAMREICNVTTRNGDRVGSRPVKSITPRGTDKLYEIIANGKNGLRLRTAEKIVMLCRKAWRVVHRLYPREFDAAVPNPWVGVTLKSRIKLTKPAVTRDQVYRFASGCIEHGQPECAAVAVICFEWLQRPENVIEGHIKWSGYRSGPKPCIRVYHHKTGEVVDHPLEEILPDGSTTKFYAEAEEVLTHLPRQGISMVLRDLGNGKSKTYSVSGMEKIVQRMRRTLKMPHTFTLDACRHGGITELEEAELTDGQGRALSTHRTQDTYVRYAKRTAPRILSATRKRHAHRLANQTATSIQNDPGDAIQNGNPLESRSA